MLRSILQGMEILDMVHERGGADEQPAAGGSDDDDDDDNDDNDHDHDNNDKDNDNNDNDDDNDRGGGAEVDGVLGSMRWLAAQAVAESAHWAEQMLSRVHGLAAREVVEERRGGRGRRGRRHERHHSSGRRRLSVPQRRQFGGEEETVKVTDLINIIKTKIGSAKRLLVIDGISKVRPRRRRCRRLCSSC